MFNADYDAFVHEDGWISYILEMKKGEKRYAYITRRSQGEL